MSVIPPSERLCLTWNMAPWKVAVCTAPLLPTAVTIFTLPFRASTVEPTGMGAPSWRGAKSGAPGVCTSIEPESGAAPTVDPSTGLSGLSGSTTTGICCDSESPEPWPEEPSPPESPWPLSPWPEPESPEPVLGSPEPVPESEPEPDPDPEFEPEPESPEPDSPEPEPPGVSPLPGSVSVGGGGGGGGSSVVNDMSAPR